MQNKSFKEKRTQRDLFESWCTQSRFLGPGAQGNISLLLRCVSLISKSQRQRQRAWLFSQVPVEMDSEILFQEVCTQDSPKRKRVPCRTPSFPPPKPSSPTVIVNNVLTSVSFRSSASPPGQSGGSRGSLL